MAVVQAVQPEQFGPMLEWLRGPPLQMQVLEIWPADNPREALLGNTEGLQLRLRAGGSAAPLQIELPAIAGSTAAVDAAVGTEFTAPNGTIVKLVPPIGGRCNHPTGEASAGAIGVVRIDQSSSILGPGRCPCFPARFSSSKQNQSLLRKHHSLLTATGCISVLIWLSAVRAVPIPRAPSGMLCELSRLGVADHAKGRAGMGYRDLIPSRLGGTLIASHIRVADDGPVPDWVHFHQVKFQIIFCLRGWAELVYEDQGPSAVMRAGDLVMQPPECRHRVLAAGDGLEVVEFGCPAEHPTIADTTLKLPTSEVHRDRLWSGQKFLWHRRSDAVWSSRTPGWHEQVIDTESASGGVGWVRSLQFTPTDGPVSPASGRTLEFQLADTVVFVYAVSVMAGTTVVVTSDVCISYDGASHVNLTAGDALTLKASTVGRGAQASVQIRVDGNCTADRPTPIELLVIGVDLRQLPANVSSRYPKI